MQTYPLSQVVTWQPGTAIPAVAGTITAIGEFKSDSNQFGPWSIQTLRLTEGAAHAEVKLFDHPFIGQENINRQVTLASGQSRGKQAGLTWKQDTRNWTQGQPIRMQVELKAKTGAMVQGVSVATAAPGPAPGPAQQPPQTWQQPPQNQPQGQQWPAQQPGYPGPGPANPGPPAQPMPAQPGPAPQSAPGPAGDESDLAGAKTFVGRNRTLAALGVIATMRLAQEYQAKYGREMPRELLAPVFGAVLYGATGAGIPQTCPPALSLEQLDHRTTQTQ